MRRLKWGYVYATSGAAMAASTAGLLAAAITPNLELAMLCSETFFASLAGLLVALAFTWLGRGRRLQDKADQLEGERAKYQAARAVLDIEAERAANANERRDQEAAEALTSARESLQKEYEEKSLAKQAEMDRSRLSDVKKAWLLGIAVGEAGLTEDEAETGGVLIPWPVMPSGTATGTGRYLN